MHVGSLRRVNTQKPLALNGADAVGSRASNGFKGNKHPSSAATPASNQSSNASNFVIRKTSSNGKARYSLQVGINFESTFANFDKSFLHGFHDGTHPSQLLVFGQLFFKFHVTQASADDLLHNWIKKHFRHGSDDRCRAEQLNSRRKKGNRKRCRLDSLPAQDDIPLVKIREIPASFISTIPLKSDGLAESQLKMVKYDVA
ncbi:hypothetical protein M5K25_000637 [Dendrobium thyrsiflorum]|uniref:Uncharacterized protein n=1 Tax=Dendrobium thyrsiflorum TaxID=117978 RepID=A0ABD0W8C1_DENTH